MSRADGYQMGDVTIQGVRAYDPSTAQWVSPDAYAGTTTDPGSQKPFMWNGNNPAAYADPSGFYTQPMFEDSSNVGLENEEGDVGSVGNISADIAFAQHQGHMIPGYLTGALIHYAGALMTYYLNNRGFHAIISHEHLSFMEAITKIMKSYLVGIGSFSFDSKGGGIIAQNSLGNSIRYSGTWTSFSSSENFGSVAYLSAKLWDERRGSSVDVMYSAHYSGSSYGTAFPFSALVPRMIPAHLSTNLFLSSLESINKL